jgi:hypothetical protein
MARPFRLVLGFALLAFATLARAESLRLLAPASGATLQGGSRVELRWSATALPADAEEWEAFLSVDGGRYYGFRVTPHLDIDITRFTFTVPNVETKDARILIRAGDEREETEFEIPGSFSIVHDPHAEPVLSAQESFEHGESARKGDPEVLSWTEGARDGSGITQQTSVREQPSAIERHPKIRFDENAEGAPEIDPVGALSIANNEPTTRPSLTRRLEPPAISVDLLLVCRRRNI